MFGRRHHAGQRTPPGTILTAALLAGLLTASAPAGGPPLNLGAANLDQLRDWDARASVTHVIRLVDPQTQLIECETVVRGHSGGPLDFSLPVWRPGRYHIHDFAAAVRDVRAVNLTGEHWPVHKVDKTTWRINMPDHAVKLVYRIYANELERRMRHVDDTHAFLSGAAIFMMVEGRRDLPQRVFVQAPPGWRVTTGLDTWPAQENTYLAASYDVLVDAPLEIGTHALHEFMVDGKRHQLAIWGAEPPAADVARLTGDLARLASAHHQFWGDIPYGRYVWLLHLTAGASGGTEHLNSTIMQLGRDALLPGSRYRRLLDLSSHEFFHTWNIKRLRPHGLSPYDFSRENYSDLLWVAEGTTDYYGALLLVRAGLVSPKQYLKDLAREIDRSRERPGRDSQSLADASFDAWLHQYEPVGDADNATVSIYREGLLASLALDLHLRRHSDGATRLDDVLRTLYRRFPLDGPGFTTADMQGVIQELLGQDPADFFERHISGTEPLPLEDLLTDVGLVLKRGGPKDDREDDADPDADAGADAGDAATRPATSGATANTSSAAASGPAASQPDTTADRADDAAARQTPYVGLELVERDGLARVRRVLADGPAYAAGVQADDVIVTLDGRRLAAGELAERLRGRMEGERVRLLILRRDVERVVEVPLAAPRGGKFVLERSKAPSERQKQAYAAWLGQAW